MPIKKQIHEAQTDLMPVKKTAVDYSADDVRLILKSLTLRNMKALESKIPTASIMEHKLIQEAINAAAKGAGIEVAGGGISINNTAEVKIKGLSELYGENER